MKSFFRKIRHKIIARKLEIPANASVLDTSCQDGGFLDILAKNNNNKNLKVCGVDISKGDIEKAKSLIPKGSFEITDNVSLPFPNKTFDVVISSLTLHHMANPEISIKEMRRVLKDNGVIYLVDVIAKNKLSNFFLKHIKCPEPYHFEKFYSVSEVENLLVKMELKISNRLDIFAFPTFTIFTPISILELRKK
ncbi:MAG: class I SAM-dependent methyltransferase [Candidatus Staskawiczbacteria bacterium]|nr:class I SAM-dependent methyltransferase [Candidatus Staskawiczbacteria bacterium]